MCVHGSGQTQCGLQGYLARSAAQEVGTAYYVRDILGSIVDDDRQLICKQTVAPTDHEVTRIAGKIRGLQSLQLVCECDRAGRDPEPDGGRSVRCPHTVATPTRVVQLVRLVVAGRLRGLQLGPAAGTGERVTGGDEPVESSLISCVTLALFDDGPGPLKAERRKRCDDLLGAAGHFARRIEIFDSQQPVAADVTCIEITGSRCNERPEVQRAGRRRCETAAVFRNGRPDLSIAIVPIAVLLFPTFAALLRLDAQGRHRTRFESLDADLFAGLDAVTVGAVFDALDRFVDLANQLALAVTRAQLETELRLLRGTVVRVREIRRLVLHVVDGAIDLVHEVALPGVEDQPEVFQLLLVHVLLATPRDVWLDAARTGEQVGAGDFRAVGLVGVAAASRIEIVEVQGCHGSGWNRLGWHGGRTDRLGRHASRRRLRLDCGLRDWRWRRLDRGLR